MASVVVGCHTAAEVETDASAFRAPIPAEFWAALRERGLVRPDAPLPSADS